MKNKGQTENERRIFSRVKREMNKPRLTESVRNGFNAPGRTDRGETCCRSCASVSPDPLSKHQAQLQLTQSAHAGSTSRASR